MFCRTTLNLWMEKNLRINRYESHARSPALQAANWIHLRDKRWSRRSWLFKSNQQTRHLNPRNRREKMKRRLISIQILRHKMFNEIPFFLWFLYQIIKTAMRDAVKKYKRNMTVRPEVPPLPSLLTQTVKVTPISMIKNKSRNFPKKQTHKKNKILTDISDMYAVGLSLTK